MSKRFLMLAALGLACLAAGATAVSARGFGGGGGFHGGGFGGGDFHGGDFGGFRGGDFGGFRGEDFGRDGGWGGDRFNADGYGADRFAGDRAAGFADYGRGGAAPTRGDLNHFLGLPSDEGFHQLGGGRPANAAGQWADGGGRTANGAANRSTPTQRQAWANNVRNNFNHWNDYGAGWYANHPGAWAATGWAAGAAWSAATWPALGGWFGGWGGYGGYGAGPIDYDYGNNIVYQNGDVYMDGQDVDTAAEYYNQVAAQADSGASAPADADGQWLPLGVFALTQSDGQQSDAVVQLAVNKQGIIRGNYTDSVAGTTSPIQGSVNEKTQRVAWTVGNNQSTVLEVGLYNLTQPEAPLLIHFGADKSEQWLLVRLDQNQGSDSTAQPAAATN